MEMDFSALSSHEKVVQSLCILLVLKSFVCLSKRLSPDQLQVGGHVEDGGRVLLDSRNFSARHIVTHSCEVHNQPRSLMLGQLSWSISLPPVSLRTGPLSDDELVSFLSAAFSYSRVDPRTIP